MPTVYNNLLATSIDPADVNNMAPAGTSHNAQWSAAGLARTPPRQLAVPAQMGAYLSSITPLPMFWDIEDAELLGTYMDERTSTRKRVRQTCRRLIDAVAVARLAAPDSIQTIYGFQKRDWNAVIQGGARLTAWQAAQAFTASLLAPHVDYRCTDLYLFPWLTAYTEAQFNGYVDAHLAQLRSAPVPGGKKATPDLLVFITPQYHPASTDPYGNVDATLWARLNARLVAAGDVDPVAWGIVTPAGQPMDWNTWKATTGAAALWSAFRTAWSL